MLRIKEAVVVEGKYDKIKLKGIIDAPIIETNGFRVFKDKEKQNLIKELHESFSYYFSYENCHRALAMFNWDCVKEVIYS